MSNTKLTGSCHCKAIAFEVANVGAEPIGGIVCHCQTCRKLNTLLSYNILLTKADIHYTKGEPKTYLDETTDSGKSIERQFCGNCGSALMSLPSSSPDKAFVKVGALDDTTRVSPHAEIYMERAVLGSAGSGCESKLKHFEGMMAKEI